MVKPIRWSVAALLIALVGCDLGSTIVPRTDATLVVHAILDPSSSTQYVLVEQVRGRVKAANNDDLRPNAVRPSGRTMLASTC